ncbi:hypothetical protein FF2_006492 [Malus domestica]
MKNRFEEFCVLFPSPCAFIYDKPMRIPCLASNTILKENDLLVSQEQLHRWSLLRGHARKKGPRDRAVDSSVGEPEGLWRLEQRAYEELPAREPEWI